MPSNTPGEEPGQEGTMRQKHRYGIVYIPQRLYENSGNNRELMHSIFANLIPHVITEDPCRLQRVVYAESEAFDEVSEGENTPTYDIALVYDSEMDGFTAQFTRNDRGDHGGTSNCLVVGG